MNIYEIIVISIGLAMDAFAVSICKGLSMKKMNWKDGILIALYFGGFQGLMPVGGFLLGTAFSGIVEKIDHWIAFVLLAIIGLNMLKEALFEDDKNDKEDSNVDVKTMLILAIATSIDAFAVGVTFAFFKVNLSLAILVIGIITFVLSLLGVKIGNKFGDKFENKAEIFGGIILILMGLKILLEHLGVLSF